MISQKFLKKIALLVPPIRQVFAQRDELRNQLGRVQQSVRSSWIHHRQYGEFNVNPAIGKGSSIDDKRIIERLLAAYQRADTNQYGKDSMWRDFFETHHKSSHEVFISGDIEKSREILSNPSSNNLFYGFDELCSLFIHKFHDDPKGYSYACQDNLIRLAEAIGVFSVECPEGAVWMLNQEKSTDEILQAIEVALGVELSFPDIYPGAIGLQSIRGIITYRAIQALYLAYRVRQIAQDAIPQKAQPKICEIGAGLGRSALFASQLGINNYTLVDVPMTIISQGYYLMRCLGEDAVVLPGEAQKNNTQISLMHANDFLSSNAQFDLIANVDSITEFGQNLALQYLKKISELSPAFLSINHESNKIRVINLLKQLDITYKASRYPYWMRQGYVEELVIFNRK